MANVNNVCLKKENLFDNLSNKLAGLVYSKTDGHKQTLNIILDQFNSINFETCHITNPNKAVLVINHLCSLVPPEDTILAIKSCNFFESLITRKGIKVEGKTLSFALNWCLECMKADLNIFVLKCARALMEGDDENTEEHRERLVNEICCVLKKRPNLEVTLTCLKCVKLVISSEKCGNKRIAVECMGALEEYLYSAEKSCDQTKKCKSVIASLKGLCAGANIFEDLSDHANDLLGIAKGYMFYGLTAFEGYEIRKLYPSRVALPESGSCSKSNAKKLKGKYDRKSKKVNVGCVPSSEENEDFVGLFDCQNRDVCSFNECSDSDLSDSETDSKTKRLQSKARLWALVLLATIVKKIGPKSFVCYLPSFLPDGFSNCDRTLISCVVRDPSTECRFEAAGILLTVISDSKPYFQRADRPAKSSFTSLACGIGHTIVELHKNLTEALTSEKSVTILTRLLKCTSNMIRCTPYYKLEPGLITEIARVTKSLLKHKDINVRISALNVFGCLVSIEPKIEEAKKILLEKTFKENLDESAAKPWLFEACLSNVKKASNTASVIESLQVLGALVQNFFSETLLAFPKDIIHVLDYCSKKSEYPIKLYSGKLMETVFNALQYKISSEEEHERPSEAFIMELWDSLLKGPVTKLMEGEPMLKCIGCDCLANVGVSGGQLTSFIFDLLERDRQILCITFLFGCVRDEAPAVKSSAIRALAVFVLFPTLREDGLFLLDAIDAAVSVSKDGHPNVRMQCAWLLGNISEAIVRNKADFVDDDGVGENVLFRLLGCCIEKAGDALKIRPGALRATGNLLSILDENFVAKHREEVEKGMEILIENSVRGSFMKARWNSCYALANLLQNPWLHGNPVWVAKIFTVATELLENDKNFKVRIGAGRVLAASPKRSCYGDLYRSVWTSVFRALENSKNIADYSEFQHRDQLIDQLCLIACHLISLMNSDDLLNVAEYNFESFRYYMKNFKICVVPEKSDTILKAFDRINVLKNMTNLKNEQKIILEMLTDIFVDPD